MGIITLLTLVVTLFHLYNTFTLPYHTIHRFNFRAKSGKRNCTVGTPDIQAV